MPNRVLQAMATPMPNIYEGELVEVSDSVLTRLPAIARTAGRAFVTIGNGHAAWQMALDNTLVPGDRVLVLESGRFAITWGEMAATSGLDVEILPGDDRLPVDPDALAARLEADVDHSIDAVLVVQTDTATSVRNDISALRAAIDAANHPALFMVDCIASIGCERFEMDEWGVDLTVGASQKGLMVPPGLGFVWAGERALEAHRRNGCRSAYFDWTPRIDPDAVYYHYAGTPPISHLYAMSEALDMIDEEGGLDAVWARHETLARVVWTAIETWSTPGGLECQIVNRAHRSTAVTTVRSGSIDPDQLRQICEDHAGLTLGLGIGSPESDRFRIGHMGHLNPPMVLGTLATIEAALHAMKAPMGGSGLAVAAEFIGSTIRTGTTP